MFGTLAVFRFISNFGLGGEVPVALTLTAEYSPSRIRGRMTGSMMAAFPLGLALAALLINMMSSDPTMYSGLYQYSAEIVPFDAVMTVTDRQSGAVSRRSVEAPSSAFSPIPAWQSFAS